MNNAQLINLSLIIIGISGSIYALYSIFIRVVRREIANTVKSNLLELKGQIKIQNANHR